MLDEVFVCCCCFFFYSLCLKSCRLEIHHRHWFPPFQNIYEVCVKIVCLVNWMQIFYNAMYQVESVCKSEYFFLFRTVVFQNNVLYEDYTLTIHVTVISTCVTKTQKIFRSYCVTMMLHTILNHLRPKVRFTLTFLFNSLPDKEHTIGWFTVFEHLSKTIPDNLTDGF